MCLTTTIKATTTTTTARSATRKTHAATKSVIRKLILEPKIQTRTTPSCSNQYNNHRENNNENNTKNYQRMKSILFMGISSAIHFSGYEFSKSCIMTLLTSHKMGFTNPSIAPISTVCMTPTSLLVLWVYTKCLHKYGPRQCLAISTLFFAFIMMIGGCILTNLQSYIMDDHVDIISSLSIWQRCSQMTIFILHIIQGALVQLLYTQHWSFIGSISKNLKNSTAWFAPIAGLGSIGSTIAAFYVPTFTANFGLTQLLLVSASCLFVSCYMADLAYRSALQHHLLEPTLPSSTMARGPSQSINKRQDHQPHSRNDSSLLQTSIRLFTRVPILASLCREVLTCQCVASIVNFLFIIKVKQYIPNDEQRSNFTSQWYARINCFSGILQFCILPLLMNQGRAASNNNNNNNNDTNISNRQNKLWLLMPFTMMICSTLMIYESQNKNISLFMITISFAIFKILEYSIRGTTTEMIYVSLDYESRYYGKEIISLFVDRVGKSSTAVILSLISSLLEQSPTLDKIFVQTLSVASFCWLFASYPLAKHTTTTTKFEGKLQ